MKQINHLWKPEGKKVKIGIRLAQQRDPLCEYCQKKKRCSPGPCFFLARINGNKERKEELISDVRTRETEYKDYKIELSELIEDRWQRLNNTNKIEDIKQRSIAILLLAGIPQSKIASMFSMSARQINRIANKKALQKEGLKSDNK